MRVIKGNFGVVAALVLAVALALSALAGLGARRTGIPDEGPWAVQLSEPEGDWASCLDDPSLTSPTTWGSTVTAVFAQGAAEPDVERVLDCLDDAMTGGTVQVGTVDPVDA